MLYERALKLKGEVDTLCDSNRVKIERKEELFKDLCDCVTALEDSVEMYNKLSGAGNLLNKIADARVKKAIDFTVNAVNDALRRVFASDFKQVIVELSSHMDSYPQLNFMLQNPDDFKRNLKTQEGAGLSQIISLLATMCLLYISGGRRFMLLDEVLNGLHPDALELMEDILTLFEDKLGFQFMMINHGYVPNRGIVYHLAKKGGTTYCKSVETVGYDEDGPDDYEKSEEFEEEVTLQ